MEKRGGIVPKTKVCELCSSIKGRSTSCFSFGKGRLPLGVGHNTIPIVEERKNVERSEGSKEEKIEVLWPDSGANPPDEPKFWEEAATLALLLEADGSMTVSQPPSPQIPQKKLFGKECRFNRGGMSFIHKFGTVSRNRP